MITLMLPGTIRSKKNSKRPIRAGGRFRLIPSKAYLEWEERARQHANAQLGYQCFERMRTCQLHIKAIFYYKGNRLDLQGAMESLADCLEGIVYENDRQIESWDGSRMVHDKENPRTEVIIEAFENEK